MMWEPMAGLVCRKSPTRRTLMLRANTNEGSESFKPEQHHEIVARTEETKPLQDTRLSFLVSSQEHWPVLAELITQTRPKAKSSIFRTSILQLPLQYIISQNRRTKKESPKKIRSTTSPYITRRNHAQKAHQSTINQYRSLPWSFGSVRTETRPAHRHTDGALWAVAVVL